MRSSSDTRPSYFKTACRSSASTRSATNGSGAVRSSSIRRSPAPRLGGVGPGVSPAAALAVGLKVDADMVPPADPRGHRGGFGRTSTIRRTRRRSSRAKAVVGVMPFPRRSACRGRLHLRALPLDRGRLRRAGHRKPPRRLAQSRSQRRCDSSRCPPTWRRSPSLLQVESRHRAHGPAAAGAPANSTRTCSSTARRSALTAGQRRR